MNLAGTERLKSFINTSHALEFDPTGRWLANAGDGPEVEIRVASSGRLLKRLSTGHLLIESLQFAPRDKLLAVAGIGDPGIELWNFKTNSIVWRLRHEGAMESLSSLSIAFHPDGRFLFGGGSRGELSCWDVATGQLVNVLGPTGSSINGLAFLPKRGLLACALQNHVIQFWDALRGRRVLDLERHTSAVETLRFSGDGKLMASASIDGSLILWNTETWEPVASILLANQSEDFGHSFAFHPERPVLAASSVDRAGRGIAYLFQLDYSILLGSNRGSTAGGAPIHHTTAKIVLLGDHSVGKSALGHHLIHGQFEKQESTHGQKFWVFTALGMRRSDGTECEAILWDFAGQPDYRLVHALFVDSADLALVLFDASDIRDPLHGVGFWLKQLRSQEQRCPIILVAAQTDRGSCALTDMELSDFCHRNGLEGPVSTSALTGFGMPELVRRMKALIPWDNKALTITTETFRRVKSFVLGLKQAAPPRPVSVTPAQLRSYLEGTDSAWLFTDAEMLTAVGHLENYGYVKRLRASTGALRILLEPERLNNLASSLVLEARRNPKGLGALEERRLLAGGYPFQELNDLSHDEASALLDSAALLFIEHNVCFREMDPLRMEPFLVFPELINLKQPPEEDPAVEEGVSYDISGPTENVFASLVVLLGYTHTFLRASQWHDNARYEFGSGLVCGFTQEPEGDGEITLVLRFSPNVGLPVRTLFQGLVESFLARRNLTVLRYHPVRCDHCNQLLSREVVRLRTRKGQTFAFCNDCGEKLPLPKMSEPIQLTHELQAEVESQRAAAEQRTRFEQVLYQVRTYVNDQGLKSPETFISYAWGDPRHERWVEKRLATDLQKAGIDVVLDRWHNSQIGASVARFVERIESCDRVVMIGTPSYRRKYDNKDRSTGYVVAAEIDVVNNRLLGTEAQKQTVLPVLFEGEKADAFPPLLHGRVYADFRDERSYFSTALDLVLTLYGIPHHDQTASQLRESLLNQIVRVRSNGPF